MWWPRPLTSELPGSLLQVQIHEPHSRIIQLESPVVESMHLHSPRASQMFLCRKKFEKHHISSLQGSTMMSPGAIWRALLCLGPTLRHSDLIGLECDLRICLFSRFPVMLVLLFLGRGTLRSSLRSPAEVDGTQGFLPQPEKDTPPSHVRKVSCSTECYLRVPRVPAPSSWRGR